MKDNSQKVVVIGNFITVVCGVIALFLLFNGGVNFEHPMMWLLCLMVISSISTLITQGVNLKKKKYNKKPTG